MKKARDENLERRREFEKNAAGLLKVFRTVYGLTLDADLASVIDNHTGELERLREEALRQILEELSDFDRYLLKLYKVDGLSLMRIAELTGEDADWLQFQLIKIEAKVCYQARRHLKASGKKSLF